MTPKTWYPPIGDYDDLVTKEQLDAIEALVGRLTKPTLRKSANRGGNRLTRKSEGVVFTQDWV